MEKVRDTKSILTTYLRRLTNLSGNNRSLYLPKLSNEQYLDVHDLRQLRKEKSFSIVECLIARKEKIICALMDSRMEAVNEMSKKLKKLQRLDHFLFEERGSRDLHVGWPFVRGKFADGTFVRCPLLFFPVELEIENNSWMIKPRENAEITFNKSFVLAHSFYHQLPPSENLLDEDFDDADKDSTVFRTFIYQLLQKSNIDINFNADNYQDELISFASYKKEEFDKHHFNGQLKLFPEAVLGIFPQSGSYLIPDYTHLIEKEKIENLEIFFAEKSLEENDSMNFLQQVKEERVFPAFPMDAWQENALKAVKVGHSLVVQGPPGTGKSQLICNLIADGLANGKKILVVCQKRAAIDVVYTRLAENKIDDFLALVHDFKNDRKEIYQKAASQIDRIDDYTLKNNSIDSIQLERKFFQISRSIDQITEELEEYKHTLFDESECGYCPKELYLISHLSEPTINVKQEYRNFTRPRLEEFVKKLKQYINYASKYKKENYPLLDRKSFITWSVKDWKSAEETLKDISPYFTKLQNELQKIVSARPDWENCEEFWKHQASAVEMAQLLNNETIYNYFLNLLPYPDDETNSLWLANSAHLIIDCFKAGIEASVPTIQLGEFQEALQRTTRNRGNFFGRVIWNIFSKDKSIIKQALTNNNLELSKDGLHALEKKLDNRLNLEHNLSKLKKKQWLPHLPEKYDQKEFETWFDHHQKAIRAKLIFNFIRGLKNFIHPPLITLKQFQSKLDELYKTLYAIQEQKEKWLVHLTPSQIEKITKDNGFAEILIQTLRKDFDMLCELDKIEDSFNSDEKKIITKLYEVTGKWDSKVLCKLLLNSVYMAWLDHLEIKYPVLRIPSSGRLYTLECELRELVEEKEKISIEILLLRARERVVDNLEFNRLSNRVTYRDLHHQLTKKKKIWPVRKTISEFEDEIFRILPCWLVSPESASAIFPMRAMFDLVIFDEASQCFAEQGIPSLFRAKQVVIAGDSQQLKPNDLYMTRWREEEQDDMPELEVDSLLDLGSRYFKSITLQGHYRSQSVDLIEFSNYHFYKNQLKLLPHRTIFNTSEPVIEYVKTDGKWENNSNLKEAEKIAELIHKLNSRNSGKSIGVVTFNAPQQMLVLDVLEEKFASDNLPLPVNLFVKNIENVQGDERDIIIFSIGYAPDKKGKVNAQFGSLNLAGGENRLNVAITRAREKIFIVSSVLPNQLYVDDTRNLGPKILKAYLEYALQISNRTRAQFPVKRKNNAPLNHKLKNLLLKELPDIAHTFIEDETVPFSDLVIKKQEEYDALLLTDDTLYYQSLSAKAWHAQTPRLFESKNWKYTIAYSRNYWTDPKRFMNDIERFMA